MAETLPAPDVAVPRCPICESDHYRVAFTEPPYEVRRCANCGAGWVSPRRDEAGLAAIYAGEHYWRSTEPKSMGYTDYRGEEARYLRTFRLRLDHVLRDGPRGGRALDVGSAAGFCLAVLRERGFEVHGVELSADIASHAIDQLGFDTVHVGTLDTAPFPDASFDLLTMWDVLEHVVDPLALLREARRKLTADGLLVIETQDIDSPFARVLGRRWQHYKHPEHILHFTPSSLERLLVRAGFRLERLTHRYGGKYVPLSFVAERAGRVHPAHSRLLAPLAGRTDSSLYLNPRDEMIVLARPA
jgi:2-polyprenyl-3-methyl-5-hydroxy-6-metoxy-1,4-benzoquinol methylase